MVTAIAASHSAASTVAEAADALSSPVTSLSEVAGRLGDAELTERTTRLQTAYSGASGAAGRYAGREEPREGTILSEAAAQMKAVTTEIKAQANTPARIQRLTTVTLAALDKLTEARDRLAATIAARLAPDCSAN